MFLIIPKTCNHITEEEMNKIEDSINQFSVFKFLNSIVIFFILQFIRSHTLDLNKYTLMKYTWILRLDDKKVIYCNFFFLQFTIFAPCFITPCHKANMENTCNLIFFNSVTIYSKHIFWDTIYLLISSNYV